MASDRTRNYQTYRNEDFIFAEGGPSVSNPAISRVFVRTCVKCGTSKKFKFNPTTHIEDMGFNDPCEECRQYETTRFPPGAEL